MLAGVPAVPPSPICLARLLVTRENSILVEARSDGRGLDIPTRRVRDGEWEEQVEDLLRHAGVAIQPRLLGFVRNHVPGAPEGYPWPSPHAHFAVWHCPLPAQRDAPGTWLNAADAETHLSERHWWPLAAHASPLSP